MVRDKIAFSHAVCGKLKIVCQDKLCLFFFFAVFHSGEGKYSSVVVLPMKKINWRDLSGLWSGVVERGVVADSSEKRTCFSFLVC